MTKPICEYVPSEYDYIRVGDGAIIHHRKQHHTLGEPKKGKATYTSDVIAIDGDDFETRNTLYKAVKDEVRSVSGEVLPAS